MPRTQIVPLQENKAISQNNSDDSDEHDISEIAQSGMFSIQVIISDTSTSTSITITYLLSLDGINFATPTNAVNIATAIDISSGLNQIYTFEPEVCKWLQIRVTENDTGAVAGLYVYLGVQ